jgi:putative hydrolase of HD superfamily
VTLPFALTRTQGATRIRERFAANFGVDPLAERPYTPGDIELAVERFIEEGAATRGAPHGKARSPRFRGLDLGSRRKKKDMEEEVAKYLFELGTLKRVRRTGWWLAGIRDTETVAEHSFRTAAIAYILAHLEDADPGKAVAMGLFHDVAETRVNDLHRLGKTYVDWSGVEEKVLLDQTRKLPKEVASSLRGLFQASQQNGTIEARVAADADALECLLQACEYAEAGHPVQEWIKSSVEVLQTTSGRRVAKAILEQKPDTWRTDRKD